MHSAYKHLDSKLRIAELSVGQWIAVLAGLGLAIVWGLYVSPFGTTLTLTSAVYIAALPATTAVFASLTEFNLILFARSALAWGRFEGRFMPGPGTSARGYTVRDDLREPSRRASTARVEELDLAALWGES